MSATEGRCSANGWLAGDELAVEGRLHLEVAPAQDDLARSIGIEPQPLELPVTLLGRVGQQPLRRVAAGAPRQEEPLELVVDHRRQRYAAGTAREPHWSQSVIAAKQSGEPGAPR